MNEPPSLRLSHTACTSCNFNEPFFWTEKSFCQICNILPTPVEAAGGGALSSSAELRGTNQY